MEKRKLTKEDIDKVRNIEGFPIGDDEDIISLSDAPYYTACPNPFIEDFIAENGTLYDEKKDDYHKEPFATDVSEGKTDPIYMAHAYHTKVPYKAIMKYILHYTKPGDLVFDGFCGTGMTGVAAQMCGEIGDIDKMVLEKEMNESIVPGPRKAILNDLSPIATSLSAVYNSEVDAFNFPNKLGHVVSMIKEKYGWVYETNHVEHSNTLFKNTGEINYTIWSDVFICPHCGEELVFWNVAVDAEKGNVKEKFICPKCHASLTKTDCQRAIDISIDETTNEMIKLTKQVPVLINYSFGGKRFQKKPDKEDLEVIERVNNMTIPYWYPTDLMMGIGEKWGDSWRAGYHQGFSRVNHFFYKRSLLLLSYFYELAKEDKELRFLFTSILQRASKLFKWSKNQAGPLSGTLYISSCTYETSIFSLINNKKKLFDYWKAKDKQVCINCASLTDVSNIPNNTIDYIFTDPPFGDNLMYSELSFLWEAWLKVKTNNNEEAIMSPAQSKGLMEYQGLMTDCFKECYRILKPDHWMTVEFHNSKNAVWNAIQESLNKAGFIIADIRTLDKKQGSFKQVNNSTAVKQDLVISVYKPKSSFKQNLLSKAGLEDTAWEFARQYLANLPVTVVKNGKIEIIAERQAYLLFDRMVAYHIMNGLPVPVDASYFYRGLDEKFLKRDNMYFLSSQVNEYDMARIYNDIEPLEFSLFVNNEKSAIAWLYQELDNNAGNGPQTYAEIQPKFMQEVKSIEKYEQMPELSVLLEENFIKDENERWYIPDRTKEADIAKLREKNLLKEFDGYLRGKGKLKVFRSEAIRLGFSKLWKEKNYMAIVGIAERLPEQVIQEDPNLLMYYDISLNRI